jgi:Na+/H+ antiporter NhaD/arsenite permease-like protein
MLIRIIFVFFSLFLPASLLAQELSSPVDLSRHWAGYLSLAIFLLAYIAVITEEFTDLRKSKPVLFAAGLIWTLIGWFYVQAGFSKLAEQVLRENLLNYTELMLFMMVSMIYVNALEERRVFETLRCWLVNHDFTFRKLFWLTGLISFLMSPVADNLITALLMGALVIAIGQGNTRFIALGCLNVVIASNAGGVFSPFGDITTLMIWQADKISLWEFVVLLPPALVAYLVPATMLNFALPSGKPNGSSEKVRPLRGAMRIFLLFMLTIVTTIYFNYGLNLPPVIGMLTGLSYLKIFGYYLKKTSGIKPPGEFMFEHEEGDVFDVFNVVARVEWDTVLFFYGVIMCVGGLGFLGYLSFASDWLYQGLGTTQANILLGIFSAFLDSIPVMYGILIMNPDMGHQQWLLLTLGTGLGGSLLAIGSTGGVALMGQARGVYTFFYHLKWMPAILLGYALAIYLLVRLYPEHLLF